MSLLVHIIMTYIKLYSPPRNPRAGSKSPALFVRKPLCMGSLSPAFKIFIEGPGLQGMKKAGKSGLS